MASENIKDVTNESFVELVGKGVVVLDFWAPWCGPCKMQAPFFEMTAKMMEGLATFGKVNIDEAGDLAARFGVRSIPTIIVLKNGEAVETKVGLTRTAELSEMVKKHLA